MLFIRPRDDEAKNFLHTLTRFPPGRTTGVVDVPEYRYTMRQILSAWTRKQVEFVENGTNMQYMRKCTFPCEYHVPVLIKTSACIM